MYPIDKLVESRNILGYNRIKQKMRFCLHIWSVSALTVAGLSAATVLSIPSRSSPPAKVTAVIRGDVRADPRTGQFVKTVIVTSRPVPSRVVSYEGSSLEELLAPARIGNSAVRTLVEDTARHYEVSPALVDSVIQVESNYNPHAVSPKGAQGLMQLMPGTAGEMYVRDPVDPAQNVLGGTRYLRYLANSFGGDMVLVLAAYNAGPEAVKKYGGVPPFAETRDYVRRVMSRFFELKQHAGGKVDAAEPSSESRGRP